MALEVRRMVGREWPFSQFQREHSLTPSCLASSA